MTFLFSVFHKVLRKHSVGVSFGYDEPPSVLEFLKRRAERKEGRRE